MIQIIFYDSKGLEGLLTKDSSALIFHKCKGFCECKGFHGSECLSDSNRDDFQRDWFPLGSLEEAHNSLLVNLQTAIRVWVFLSGSFVHEGFLFVTWEKQ